MPLPRLIRALGPALAACLIACIAHATAPPAHTHAAATLPQSCQEAVSQLADLAKALDQAVAAPNANLAPAADDAFAATELARNLGRLALNDPLIPRDKVKPINLAGKSIADAAAALHDALDANKPDSARTALAALKPLIADLTALLPPDPWICEMRCEGKKSYDHPGTCPVCHMDLIRQSAAPFAVLISAASDSSGIVAGRPITLDIRLLDQVGDPVGAIDIVHEHTLHFMLFSEDLSFYAHEHPTRTPDGVFHLENFTFPFGGRFIAFADFTPTAPAGKAPINRIARTEFTLPSGDTPPHAPVALHENEDDLIQDPPYEIGIRCNGGKFFAGRDSYLRYGVSLHNEPVTDLEPIMGAMGHLVIISADTNTYLHCHPLSPPLPPEVTVFTNGKPTDVVFHTYFPKPGMYRAFAQFQHKGRIILSAVTIDAKVPEDGIIAPEPAHQHHH